MDKEGENFALLKHKCPKIYEVKITEGILFCTQIKQLFEKKDYGIKFNATEWRVWGHLESSLETF